jgi:hypothetical protein
LGFFGIEALITALWTAECAAFHRDLFRESPDQGHRQEFSLEPSGAGNRSDGAALLGHARPAVNLRSGTATRSSQACDLPHNSKKRALPDQTIFENSPTSIWEEDFSKYYDYPAIIYALGKAKL